jgi:hypothetical protein
MPRQSSESKAEAKRLSANVQVIGPPSLQTGVEQKIDGEQIKRG